MGGAYRYISYIAIEKEEIREYSGVLYAVFIIPAIIIVALVCAVIADYREKKKRNAKRFEKPNVDDNSDEPII